MPGWLKRVLVALPLAIAWLALSFLMLALPPAAGLAWVVAVALLFLALHVWWPAREGGARRLAWFRVRPLPRRRAWLRSALPAVLCAGAGVTWLLALVAGRHVLEAIESNEAWLAIDAYMGSPLGWLGIALLVAVVGPLIEEFYFRGLIQRALERRFGPAVAIGAAAALFGFVHLHGWPWMLQPFALGLLWGWLAWATRSIWAAVIAHGAWNGGGLLLGSLTVSAGFDAWEQPGLSLAGSALLLVVAVALVRGWRRGP